MHITWHADDIRAGRRLIQPGNKRELLLGFDDSTRERGSKVLLLIDLADGCVLSHAKPDEMAHMLTYMQAHPKELYA